MSEQLVITTVPVGPKSNNAYLLRCRQTGEALLVDAADEAARLLDLLRRETGGRLAGIVTTHRHDDHWQALRELVDATGAVTYAGRYDADDIPVGTDVRLDDGDRLRVGRASLDVIHLRGHTPGSIALAYTDALGATDLLTGDSLFPGRGRQDRHTRGLPQAHARRHHEAVRPVRRRCPRLPGSRCRHHARC